MGLQASIDIHFAHRLSPKDTAISLINSGWSYDFEGSVIFLMANDADKYDWQEKPREEFNFEDYINSHNDQDKLGIVLINKDNVGGEFLIYPDWLSFSLSINRRYLTSKMKVPDFSWYLSELNFFLELANISNIQCELVY